MSAAAAPMFLAILIHAARYMEGSPSGLHLVYFARRLEQQQLGTANLLLVVTGLVDLQDTDLVHVVNSMFYECQQLVGLLWSPCDSYYKYQTERRMAGKLTNLIRELVMDVEMKIKAVQKFRDQYYKSLQYQLGDIVYEMRNHFKAMVRLYQLTHQEIFYGHGHTHKSIPRLIDVQRMAMEIETKVRTVQGWLYRRETKEEHRERMLSPLRSGKPRGDDENEPLREAAARARMQQSARPRPRPAAPVPPPALPRRKNNKWRHVTNNDFSQL